MTSTNTAFLRCDGTYSVSFQSFDDDDDEGTNPVDSNNTDGADSFNGDGANPLKGNNNNGADSFDNTDDTTDGDESSNTDGVRSGLLFRSPDDNDGNDGNSKGLFLRSMFEPIPLFDLVGINCDCFANDIIAFRDNCDDNESFAGGNDNRNGVDVDSNTDITANNNNDDGNDNSNDA